MRSTVWPIPQAATTSTAPPPPSRRPWPLWRVIGAGRHEQADPHLHWLAKSQADDGSVPPLAELKQPGWTTPWAIVAAVAAKRNGQSPKFNLDRAQQWLLSQAGAALDLAPQFGHNGKLIGWPWVAGTHSWQEPTAMSVLALKALGLGDHPRTREGVQLLVDRLLVTGGCNYGNTVVLGQRLRPQVEPTGLALVALGGENINDPRIDRSLQFLNSALSAETTPISLGYGLLGLTAHNRRPADAANWLETAYRQTIRRDASPLSLAWLVLASQAEDCPLITLTQTQNLRPLKLKLSGK